MGAGSRRQALLEAMIRVVGRGGYPDASVASVVAEAHASRATFYKHFDNRRDCFLAAHEWAVERVLASASASCERNDTWAWAERARAGLAAVIALFVREPELARALVVEAAAAGDDARRQHWAAIGRLADLLDKGRERAEQPRLPPNTAQMAVGGVAGLVLDSLQAGEAAKLPHLLPELEFALLVPFVGPRTAAEKLRRSAALVAHRAVTGQGGGQGLAADEGEAGPG